MSVCAVGWQVLPALMGNVTVISWVSQLLSWSLLSRCSGLTIRAVGQLYHGPGHLDKLAAVQASLYLANFRREQASGTTTQLHLSLCPPLLVYSLPPALPSPKSLKIKS